jgi:quinol monooxygenase YgiN
MKFMHVTLRVKPDKAALYEKTFLELRKMVLEREPGALVFEACKDPDVPNGYRVFEAYKDQDAITSHSATEYYLRTAKVFVECLEGDHMDEIKRRGLEGREMYTVIKGIKFERFETI